MTNWPLLTKQKRDQIRVDYIIIFKTIDSAHFERGRALVISRYNEVNYSHSKVDDVLTQSFVIDTRLDSRIHFPCARQCRYERVIGALSNKKIRNWRNNKFG